MLPRTVGSAVWFHSKKKEKKSGAPIFGDFFFSSKGGVPVQKSQKAKKAQKAPVAKKAPKKMEYHPDTDYARGVACALARAGLPVVYHVLFGGAGEMRHELMQLPTSLFVTDAPSSVSVARADVGVLLRYLEGRSDSELHGRSPRAPVAVEACGDAAVVQAVAEYGTRVDALRVRIATHDGKRRKRPAETMLR